MAENSKIEWCDHTWNPWIGCTKVSDGCKNCYAERDMDIRRGRAKWGPGNPRSRTSEAYWRKPHTWNRKAEAAGRRDKVFCASLADVFDSEVPAEWRWDLYELIMATPYLDWLLLTKRPENAHEMISQVAGAYWKAKGWGDIEIGPWPDNVWLGVSVEDQKTADERIPIVQRIPAAVRFLSMEPLLGSTDLRTGIYYDTTRKKWLGTALDLIHWVIVGGESGPGARPMHPDWARSLRDQCQAASVPFFFKQWGEWAPESVATSVKAARNALYVDADGSTRPAATGARCGAITMQRTGKKSAGRMLDGREWNEFPAREKEV